MKENIDKIESKIAEVKMRPPPPQPAAPHRDSASGLNHYKYNEGKTIESMKGYEEGPNSKRFQPPKKRGFCGCFC